MLISLSQASLWTCVLREAPRGERKLVSAVGFAKKIPLGFWKEKIPELNTGPSMSLQVEWQGLSVGRIHREQVRVWEFMQ